MILLLPWKAQGRDASQITDWYIKDFQSVIVVNKDSSLDITEKISADCGNLPGKHGIFRILPTRYKNPETGKWTNAPIRLESITDFSGNSHKFSTIKNYSDHTVTWKIGDPKKTVTGVNNYEIKYHVENAILFDNSGFDRFYWNLNGNFWQIGTEQFTGKIIFPQEMSSSNSQVQIYSGNYANSSNQLDPVYSWPDANILEVKSQRYLNIGDGITVSVTLPKNIFTPYKPSIFSLYGPYLMFLLPLFFFVYGYRLWSKFGRDPKINPVVVPEFAIPENLNPMEMGIVMTNGSLKTNVISAAIVNFAVKKIIKIERLPKEGILGKEDYKLILVSKDYTKEGLNEGEVKLMRKLFQHGKAGVVKISELKNEFYQDIGFVANEVKKPLLKEKVIQPWSYLILLGYVIFAFFVGYGAIATISFAWQIPVSLFLSAAIILIYGILMPQRSLRGAELNKKIQGFKLYMETAEKYRQRFNEKENIFEKFLPYAMVFGITGLWIKKMKEIYGEQYFSTYHPVWFYGAGIASFNADNFNSAISSLSSNMSSTMASAPSSGGGGGFSGGGGGGGGGGGW